MDLITVIVPCYNEEASLKLFYRELNNVTHEIKNTNFEILFINDGSSDKTLDILKKFSKDDDRVKYISFSRNFGKEAAIMAGLENSRGDYVTLMDADLQDPPPLVDSIVSLKEYNRYSKGLFSFVGYNTKWIEYKNIERVAWESKWAFFKLFKYALEGIIAFSTAPLSIAVFLFV